MILGLPLNGKAAQKRLEARLYRAKLAAMHGDNSISVAAVRFCLPKFTLFDYMKSSPYSARIGRPPELAYTEEKTVLDTPSILFGSWCSIESRKCG